MITDLNCDTCARLYEAIDIAYNPVTSYAEDEYYEKYIPAFHYVDNTSEIIADGIWNKDSYFEEWPPDEVAAKVRKGMKAGYLWAKAELTNA